MNKTARQLVRGNSVVSDTNWLHFLSHRACHSPQFLGINKVLSENQVLIRILKLKKDTTLKD